MINIINGNLILPGGVVRGGQLVIDDGKIMAIHERPVDVPGAVVADAGGRYVSPGFIDIHVHGGAGYDFMDGTREAFLEIARLHARHGTTALMPTTLSGSREELIGTLEAYAVADRENRLGARFVGMHLEGPYFAMGQRGAQDPKYIRAPDPSEYEEVVRNYPFIKRWSAAPELPGALAFGDYMVSHGVLPAWAHTEALYKDVERAFDHGFTLSTHLYSAMLGVTRRDGYRYAGAVEAAFLIDEMDVEIIADGVHLPAPLLRLIYKIKGADRVALITDAMRGTGMPEGRSILGSLKNGVEVLIEDGVAKLTDRSAFAGSVATADRLVRTMIGAGIPLADVVLMISQTPARILGISDRKGTLEIGKDADVVIFDDAISVLMTIVEGRVVYDSRTA